MATWKTIRGLRGLVYDVENKPGTYGPGDYTHPKMTAIGCQWLDGKRVYSWCFDRRDKKGMQEQSEEFRKYWDAADFVVGHNIRRHDWKLLVGHFTHIDLPPPEEKRMVDTFRDQPRMEGLSRSLENLSDRWESPIAKIHLSEFAWEQAYDGIPKYVDLMRKRVVTDVKISVWLYNELRRRGLLRVL